MHHDGFMGWGGNLFRVVLILTVAALTKFLFGKSGGHK